MGGTPNIAGMIADPDFQGLSPADKRAALGKVTGDQSFASLNDGETMQFISRFQKPQAQTSQLINPAAQAKQQLMAQAPGLTRDTGRYPTGVDVARDQASAQAQSGLAAMMGAPDVSRVTPEQAKTGIGTGLLAGSAMVAPVATATGVLGAAAGQKGFETGAWKLGASPGAAEMWGTTGGIVGGLVGGEAGSRLQGPIADIGKGISRQVGRLFGETPERIAELKALPQTEEAIRQRVVQTEANSRAAFKAAYPPIDAAAVDVSATRNLAKQAIDKLPDLGQAVPRPLPAVAQAQNMLTAETGDIGSTMKMLTEGGDTMPFRQAQELRSALNNFIARSGGRLPAVTYNAMKSVADSITDGLKSTATREGVLEQFNAAEGLFRQHAADFWNRGAPLKPFLQTQPNATGQTLNKFTQTATQSRAFDALNRRGVPIDDLKGLLGKGTKALKADIRDAATVRNLGEGTLNEQVATKTRKAALEIALKGGASLTGLGGLYQALKHIAKP